MELKEKRDYLTSHTQNMIKMLQDLVNVDCGSMNVAGVHIIADKLVSYFKILGNKYSIERITGDRGEPHLIIRRPGSVPGKILILGHMDTVFPEGTVERRPFKIVNDKAYGPGVADMKAGIVTLYHALKLLDDLYPDDLMDIEIILNGDEEISSLYSKRIIEREAEDANYALVVEPGRLDWGIVTGRKGVGRFRLTVKGKKAHAGTRPQDGINAIVELSHKIIELDTLNDYDRGVTLNTGVITGGTTANTVPDSAEASIDIRFKTKDDGERLVNRIQEICGKSYIKGSEISLEGGITRPPMERTKKNIELFNILKSIGTEMGLDLNEVYTGGGSDGNFTGSMGIPTIDSLGPIGTGTHSEREYIELDTMIPKTILLSDLIYRLSKED